MAYELLEHARKESTNLQPHGKLVDACSRLPCPEGLHRKACKYTAKDSPDGIDNDDTHYNATRDLKLLGCKDSLILEEDGGFCQA
jgi:hypothetical protein